MPSKVAKTDLPGALPESSFTYGPLRHVRWLFTTFVQGLFAAAPRGSYHWSEDTEQSEIFISDESPIQTDKLNQRPAISFTRAPIGFFSLGFDDMLSYDMATGKKTKSVLIPGTMMVNCCSRNDLESEHIAWVVAEHIWLLRDLLLRQGFYDVGRGIQVGSPTPPGALIAGDNADEWYCTTATVPYHFYRTSSFYPLNKQVVQDITSRLNFLPPRRIVPGVSIQTGADMPREIQALPPEPVLPTAPKDSPTSPGALPRQPHPLNPAQQVTVLSVRTDVPAIRPPSINGRRLPIPEVRVGQSATSTGVTIDVKV